MVWILAAVDCTIGASILDDAQSVVDCGAVGLLWLAADHDSDNDVGGADVCGDDDGLSDRVVTNLSPILTFS